MTSKINISIPKPCHENWQAMSATEKGRFCGSCQKNVFDFTSASDRQIIDAYNKDKNLCGRFLNTQLDRDLVKPKEKSSIWLVATSAIVSLLALGTNEVFAQGEPRVEQTDKKMLPENSTVPTLNQEKEITGIVTDQSGSLPGVNIVVKGTQRNTQTEFDGTFRIVAKEGETLIFSFLGMEDKSVVVGSESKYVIRMKDNVNSELIYLTTGGIGRRRTFFGRQFYRIRNWFR